MVVGLDRSIGETIGTFDVYGIIAKWEPQNPRPKRPPTIGGWAIASVRPLTLVFQLSSRLFKNILRSSVR